MAFLIALTLILSQAPTLRVVVLEGEDAVNIVQQKTAVRPLVEVRDRNNLPVPGASVTFTVGAGQPAAFAGGAQTVTITTNASGQAAATGFNATGAGKVTIQVQAAHQGQVASAAITQTNFVTAAAAAAAGVAATTTGAAAAGTTGGTGAAAGAAGATGAAGAGGGISMTTIALVGGAVAGGAVVAQQTGLLGGNVTYTGPLSGQYVWTNRGVLQGTGIPFACSFTRSISGEMTFELDGDGASGRGTLEMTHTDLSVSGPGCNMQNNPLNVRMNDYFSVGGGPSELAFNVTQTTSTGPPTSAFPTQRSDQFTFNGSLSGTTITGTFRWETSDQTGSPNGTMAGSGSFSIPVTLQQR